MRAAAQAAICKYDDGPGILRYESTLDYIRHGYIEQGVWDDPGTPRYDALTDRRRKTFL